MSVIDDPQRVAEDERAAARTLAAQQFVDVGFAFLSEISDGAVCTDGSCIRCRIAAVLFEVERGIAPNPVRQDGGHPFDGIFPSPSVKTSAGSVVNTYGADGSLIMQSRGYDLPPFSPQADDPALD